MMVDMLGIGRFSGIALECRDPSTLAAFYTALTGWPIVYASDDWVSIGESRDAPWHLSFQRSPAHEPPAWPDPASSMQFHLHVRVDDPIAAQEAVLALGGVRFPDQPNPNGSLVFADPAGHPFCLVFG
jgi:catechol 2,3-dioxygenase-like lactoylglutathione lyase family enzyme